MPLTDQQKDLIKACVPALQEHGVEVAKIFYTNMLRENPPLREIFNKANQVHQHQPRALAASVYAYAANIDNLATLGDAVELIANKHASLYVRPEQYEIVGKYLLAAMKEVLGDAVTPELLEAWKVAYGDLADIFIKREGELYKNAHGWTDWRDFRIAKKEKEGDEITSFYLEPVDESVKPLPPFLPGQYISIQIDVPTLGHRQARQYSLSDAPWPDYYRVSIKREAGVDPTDPSAEAHPGLISNIMHDLKKEGDVVGVSHPMGDFFLQPNDADEKTPLVLLSGGVGLTCLTSILNSLMAGHSQRPISWIHGARSTDVRAFAKQIKDIQCSRENVKVTMFTAEVNGHDVKGVDYQHEGRVDLKKLDADADLFVHDGKTQYYVCGPTEFMLNMEDGLKARGVDVGRIHMERFGTGGVPRGA